jgi:hypothetical protein
VENIENHEEVRAKGPEIQKSKNGYFWLWIPIMILVGLFLGFIIWGGNLKKAKAVAATQMEIATTAQKNLTVEKNNVLLLQKVITDLRNEIAALKARPTTVVSGGGASSGELNALNKQVAYLQKALTQCMAGKPATNTGTLSGGTLIGTGSEKNSDVAEPAFTIAPSMASAKTQLVSSNQLVEYYENGLIPFCARYGGNSNRHIPHLAMRKYNFTDAQSNGIGGFNWYLSGTSADLVGDYGCTSDGTFFVSAKIIDAYMIPADNGVIEILAKGFGWTAKQMTKFGDYYICSGK